MQWTNSLPSDPPYRLCCGQQHYSAQCPDGKVMCGLCYNRFDTSDLWVDDDGIWVDVCKVCEIADKQVPKRNPP